MINFKEKLKSMVFGITTAIVFLLGWFLRDGLKKRDERKGIKDYYNEKRKNHDLTLKLKHDHIDSTPIAELLTEGEYLRRKED